MSSPVIGEPIRLTPGMSNRRLQVRDFVAAYITSHGEGPSEYEVGAGCGISRSTVRAHLKALVAQGHFLRLPGPRGLMLPSAIDDAKRRLRDAGWRIDEDFLAATPRPDSTLLALVELDYPAGRRMQEDSSGGIESSGQGGPRAQQGRK